MIIVTESVVAAYIYTHHMAPRIHEFANGHRARAAAALGYRTWIN